MVDTILANIEIGLWNPQNYHQTSFYWNINLNITSKEQNSPAWYMLR